MKHYNNIEWKAIQSALQYTGKIDDSDIRHATQNPNITRMVESLIRDGKLKRNKDGTYSKP